LLPLISRQLDKPLQLVVEAAAAAAAAGGGGGGGSFTTSSDSPVRWDSSSLSRV
jgi:hypothetical protein